MLRILDETVAYYGKNPDKRRAATETGCQYRTDDGRRCAVGRLLTDKELDLLVEKRFNENTGAYYICENMKEEFPSIVHASGFYVKLQHLHDESDNWKTRGLGKAGKIRYDIIKADIIEGKYNGTL